MKLSKSKLALAKVINENGGWVGAGSFFAMDMDGSTCTYISKPLRNMNRSYTWESQDGSPRLCAHKEMKAIQNWHQTILSREEYYQAYPEVTKQDVVDLAEAINLIDGGDNQKADSDGWIEWKGGDCPVDDCLIVEVEYNGGGVASAAAKSFSWAHEWEYSNIIKYRLHNPDVKPDFCESVTRSIPEPDAKPTIEQLAQDYRNAKHYAVQLQKEANHAWLAAEKVKGELIDAGNKAGLAVTPHETGGVIKSSASYRVGEAGV